MDYKLRISQEDDEKAISLNMSKDDSRISLFKRGSNNVFHKLNNSDMKDGRNSMIKSLSKNYKDDYNSIKLNDNNNVLEIDGKANESEFVENSRKLYKKEKIVFYI
jgi:hypothetical protein